MKKTFDYILYIIVILLFAFYESAEMLLVTYTKLSLDTSIGTLRIKLALILLCGYYFISQKKQTYDHLYNVLIVLMIYILSISLFHNLGNSFVSHAELLFNFLLPIVLFIYFYIVSEKIDNKFFIAGVIVSVAVIFYTNLQTLQLQSLFSQVDDSRIASSYIYLLLMPFFLLSQNRVLKWISVVSVAVISIVSLKRGVLISYGFALIVYYLIYVLTTKGRLKLSVIIGSCLLFVIIYIITESFFQRYAEDMLLRLSNIQADEGSYRFDVYKSTWRMIENSDVTSLCFGHGWNMVQQKSPMGFSAHNDFLELCYDVGIFGLIIYMYFCYLVYKKMFKLIHVKSKFAPAFAFSVVAFTSASLGSHVILYPFNFISVAMVWGYLLGKEKYVKYKLMKV